MVKCPACGAEIRYIPCGITVSEKGVIITDAESKELITESGRTIKGFPRHICPENKEKNNG